MWLSSAQEKSVGDLDHVTRLELGVGGAREFGRGAVRGAGEQGTAGLAQAAAGAASGIGIGAPVGVHVKVLGKERQHAQLAAVASVLGLD